MISGQSLFLYDHQVQTGSHTATTYRKQTARLLRSAAGSVIPMELIDHVNAALADALDGCVGSSLRTFDWESVLDTCQRRADLMVRTLLRGMP